MDLKMGEIEPQACYLELPPDNQQLYKIMTIENFLRSVLGRYLHFNRVNNYKDFKGADPNDGEQLTLDRSINASSKFEKDPSFSAENYYDIARIRTYACCFSLENSAFIWRNYGRHGKKGKVCLVFDFSRLRIELNRIFKSGKIETDNGEPLYQIFDINYGIIKYIKKSAIISKIPRNPIEYSYLKDLLYAKEKELRISLSTIGLGRFTLNNGEQIAFPPAIHVEFDYKVAVKNGILLKVLTFQDNVFDCFPY